jgi:hypothetical protein
MPPPPNGDVSEGGGGVIAVAEWELTGMACLLKDGFVGYLRELAKITSSVPKQELTVHYCIAFRGGATLSAWWGGRPSYRRAHLTTLLPPLVTTYLFLTI